MEKQNKKLSDKEKLRANAEAFMKKKPAIINAIKQWMSEPDALKLIHELEVNQVELEMQNEELILAREQAIFNAEKYTEFFNFAPSGYILLTKEGNINELNITAAKMLGKEHLYLTNKRFALFIAEKSLAVFNSFINRMFESKVKENCEVEIESKNQGKKYLHIDGIKSQNNKNYFLTLVDITQSKQDEEEIKRIKIDLERSIEASQIGIWSHNLIADKDLTKDVSVRNLRHDQIFGFKEKQTLWGVDKMLEFVIDEDKPSVRANFENLFNTNRLDFECRIRWQDQTIHWIAVSGMVVRDNAGQALQANGTVSDITDRKLAEEKIRKNEERLSGVFNNLQDAYFEADTKGNITFVSPSAVSIYAYDSIEEMIGMPTENLYFDVNQKYEVIEKLKEKGFILDITGLGKRKDGTGFWVSMNVQFKYDEKGEISGAIGVVRDITESKKNENALRESEERFQLLFNKAPMGYQSLDFDGNFIEINQQWLDTLGYKKKEVIGKWFGDFLTPAYQDGFRKRFPKFKAQGHIHSEFEMLHKNGNILFIAFEGRIGYDMQGDFKQTHCILQDITEKRKAEKALIESENQLKAVLESTADGILAVDAEGKIIKTNHRFNELWQIPHELIGSNDDALLLKTVLDQLENPDEFLSKVESLYNNNEEDFDTLFFKDGRTFERYSKPLELNGTLTGRVWSFRDITNRKHIEDVQNFLITCGYRSSNENFFESLAKYLSETLNFEYVCIDKLEGEGHTAHTIAIYNEGKFDNNVSYTLNQTPCGDVVGKTICCFPENVCQLFPHDEALQGLKAQSYIGTTLWSYDGKPIGLIALIGQKPLKNAYLAETILKQVAVRAAGELERKQAEEEIKRTGQHYQALIEKAPDGIALIDTEGNFKYVSPAAKKMFGYNETEDVIVLVNPTSATHPDDVQMVLCELGKIIEDPDYVPTLEYRFIDKLGHWHWVETTFSNLLANPSVESIVLNFRDITERKLAEEEISENNSRLELAMNAANMAWWEMDISTGNVIFDKRKSEMLGYPPENFKHYKDFMALVHPEDHEKAMDAMRKYLNKQVERYEIEYRILAKTGEYKWFYDIGSTSKKDSKGKPQYITGLVINITDHKKTEIARIESEARYRELFENSLMAISITDAEGNLTHVNMAYANMYGYNNPEEMLDANINVAQFYANPSDRMEVLQIISEQGYMDARELEVIRRDGTHSFLLASAMVIKDTLGNPIQYQAIHIDITKRKQAEEKLLRSEKELKKAQEITHIGSWYLDFATNEVVWSEELYKMYGFDPTKPPPPYSEHMKLFTSESWKVLSESLENTRLTGNPYELELRTVRHDGTNGWMWVRGETLQDKDAKTIGLWGAAQDITQRKLQESQLRKLSQAMEQSPASVVITNLNGEIEYVNPKFTQMTGYTLDEARGKKPSILKSGELSNEIYKLLWETISSGKEWRGEFHNKKKNGELFWEAASISAIVNEEGVNTHYLAVKEDITARKLAEEELKQKETELRHQYEIFNSLIINLPMGVFMVEAPSGKPLIANEVALTLLGRGILTDTSKQNLADVYQAYKNDTEHRYPVDEMPIIKGMKGEFSYIDDMIVIRPDGSKKQLEIFGSPVKDDKGEIWASLVSFSDITGRKQMEKLISDSELKFRTMADYTFDWEYWQSENQNIIYMSPSCERITGYTADEFTADPNLLYKIIHPDDADLFRKHADQIHSFAYQTDFIEIDFKIINKEGYTLYINHVCHPIFDKNNNYSGRRISNKDITERYLAEKTMHDIIDKNPISIQILDKNGLTIHTNPAFKLLFGSVPPADFSIFDDLQQKYPKLEALIQRAKHGIVTNLPITYFNPHDVSPEFPDMPCWVRTIIFPLKNTLDLPDKYVLMHENIYESKIASDALNEKIAELEQWQNLSIGREIKMTELKEEINGLCKQLGLDSRYEIV